MPINHPESNAYKKAGRLWRWAAVILLIATVVGISVLACTPPVSKDALNHHLALPKLYLEKGGLFELPDRIFSYYPMNLDLLYIIPLYVGNDILAKFIHFAFGLLTTMLLFKYIRRRMGSGYGLFGVLLFLSTPVVIKLSTTVYVDLGLVFFSTAALLLLLKWHENGFQARHLVLASVCCGLALGTKYHGLIVFFILTNLALLLFVRRFGAEDRKIFQIFKTFLIFVGIALILFSPWMYRNLLWKNNPLYPLFDSTFQSILGTAEGIEKTGGPVPLENQPEHIKRRSSHNHFIYRAIVFNESGIDIALIPLRIFWEGQDGQPKHFDGALNPLLILLPLFAFAGLQRDRAILQVEKSAFLFFALLMIGSIFFSVDMRVRYVLPAVPPLVILSTYGLKKLFDRVGRLQAGARQYLFFGLICLLVGGLLFQNGRYIVDLYKYVKPFSYISGKLGRDDYTARFRPDILVHRYVDRYLDEDAKILGLFLGYRSYYSNRDLVFGEATLKSAVFQSSNAGEISQHLQSRGLTHLLIRYDLFNQWVENNFSVEEKERIRRFFTEFGKPLYVHKIYGLHAVGNR